jgi:hypothetical protein
VLKIVVCAAGGLAATLWGSAASAELNVPVAARVVSFMQPPPSGATSGVILYQPGDAASEAEATAIERAAGSGLTTGKGTLRLRRVPVSALGGLAGARVAFVTQGLRGEQTEIAAAAARGGVLTITSDLSCVQANRCAVAVSSGSRVVITVSRAACKAARVQFGSAFLMLVKEV